MSTLKTIKSSLKRSYDKQEGLFHKFHKILYLNPIENFFSLICSAEFSLTPNFEYFTPNILSLTPTNFLQSLQSKTPTFSGRPHFYSYFQNASENSAVVMFVEM